MAAKEVSYGTEVLITALALFADAIKFCLSFIPFIGFLFSVVAGAVFMLLFQGSLYVMGVQSNKSVGAAIGSWVAALIPFVPPCTFFVARSFAIHNKTVKEEQEREKSDAAGASQVFQMRRNARRIQEGQGLLAVAQEQQAVKSATMNEAA